MINLNKILVATDFGEASDAALAYGRALARSFGATLHVIHVADDLFTRVAGEGYVSVLPELQRELEASAKARLDDLLIDNDPKPLPVVKTVVVSNTPATAIVQYAADEHVDLVVAGTHGRSGVAHLFMGSVAEKIVRTAPCPVLTVRHPEHDFVRPDTPAVTAAAKGRG
jgi:nucleotide-binding universal stress UspA family protein